MSDELTGTATAIIAACNFLGRFALFGGDCFNLALTRKWGIFECFLTAFCSSKDWIVLFYDIVKVWKTMVISSYEDRSVSISCF